MFYVNWELGGRVWHLDFRPGARKDILLKICGQKQDFWLLYILFWAPSLEGALMPLGLRESRTLGGLKNFGVGIFLNKNLLG